jgi:GTP-binding protein
MALTRSRKKKAQRKVGPRSPGGYKAVKYPKPKFKPSKDGAKPKAKPQPQKAKFVKQDRTAVIVRSIAQRKVASAFTVAIVGRPNVGKSTLFNRLVGRREALVHDRPGVTRDRRVSRGSIANLHFTVIDTAGYEDAQADTLEGRMRRQTEKAVADADVALLLVDARAGITPLDEHFAALLRRSRTPIVLVANKCEGKGQDSALYDSFRLGLGDPIPISAEHGQGLHLLYEGLTPFAPPELLNQFDDDDDDVEVLPDDDVIDFDSIREGDEGDIIKPRDLPSRPLQLAIIGRPNTGKSTLINRLLGEDRMLTGPEPGVTRDAVSIDWEYRGRRVRLVDTAGVRKRAKVIDAVEKLSVGETFEAVKLAEVVVLVVDAEAVLDNQELTLARHVIDEGRALVIAINKWDAIKEKRRALETLEERLRDSMSQVKGIPTVTISGLTGQRVDTLMDAVFKAHEVWNTHLPTGPLNRWLASAVSAHPPPLSTHKQRIKLRYITQVKTRPPTFVIFSTRAGDLPEAYMRYLANGIRDTFDLVGVPIRIYLRKPKNPYEDEK